MLILTACKLNFVDCHVNGGRYIVQNDFVKGCFVFSSTELSLQTFQHCPKLS